VYHLSRRKGGREEGWVGVRVEGMEGWGREGGERGGIGTYMTITAHQKDQTTTLMAHI